MKAINLLPRDARRSFGTFRGVGFSTGALFGALTVALVVVGAYVVLANGATNKRNELNSVQAQQAAAERQVASLKPYADLESVRQSLLDRVKTLAGSRYDWPATLARIARAFPADAGLTDLSAQASNDNGSGTSSGPSVSLSGCTPSHDAVAQLIDRLRAVDGVASVALQSSKLATASSGAGAASGGGGACGSDRPETFQLTVGLKPPTGAAAPAAGQAGAAATPGATTTTPAPAAAPATPAPAATPAPGGTQ